jgi:hypothetical protein
MELELEVNLLGHRGTRRRRRSMEELLEEEAAAPVAGEGFRATRLPGDVDKESELKEKRAKMDLISRLDILERVGSFCKSISHFNRFELMVLDKLF